MDGASPEEDDPTQSAGWSGRVWAAVDSSAAMKAHRRYSIAAGDVLAGAITYALLLAVVPVLLLLLFAASYVLGSGTENIPEMLLSLLPAGSALAADVLAHTRVPVTALSIAALVWAALALVRAVRAGIRTIWGQPIGTGVPPLDYVRDTLVGVALLSVVLVVSFPLAVAPPWDLAGPAQIAAQMAGSFLVLLLLLGLAYTTVPAKDPRVPVWARWRAAAVGAACVLLVKLAGGAYVDLLADHHQSVYGVAAALIVTLVLVNVTVRLVLRALAWEVSHWLPPLAGTAPVQSRTST